MSSTVLLINPWVRDFKCYDEWMEPLGILWIGSLLSINGVNVRLVDCLNRFVDGPQEKPGKAKRFATGDFSVVELEKPSLYRQIPRRYKQYGISESFFCEQVRLCPDPCLILVGSGMTYWHGGVYRAVELIRSIWSKPPLFLGGVYATLCREHAEKIPGVDAVFGGPLNQDAWERITKETGLPKSALPRPEDWPQPKYDLLHEKLGHRAVVSSFGCPFRCTYCASKALAPEFLRRKPNRVAAEIRSWIEQGIRDFAFYDDALLYRQEEHLFPILNELNADTPVRFHTPNGMHARWISRKTADTLFRHGFQTLRIGFETDEPADQMSTGGKVSNLEMEQALAYLREAGFRKDQIGVYLIVGINSESWRRTIQRAQWIQNRGARALPNFLSPVPTTPEFSRLSGQFPILLEDPLSHNDLFFAFHSGIVGRTEFNILKQTIRQGNL